MLAGSHWLIGMLVGGSVMRSQFDATAAVALLAAPLSAAALDARRWVVTEAAFSRGTLKQLLQDCGRGAATNSAEVGSSLALVNIVACKAGVGLMPNATRRAADPGCGAAGAGRGGGQRHRRTAPTRAW